MLWFIPVLTSRQPSATIETSAVWAGDIVYVAASDGTVYGINKEDGKVVWKHATGAPMFGSVACRVMHWWFRTLVEMFICSVSRRFD